MFWIPDDTFGLSKIWNKIQINVSSGTLLNQFGSQHYSDSHQLNVINIIPTWLLQKYFRPDLTKYFTTETIFQLNLNEQRQQVLYRDNNLRIYMFYTLYLFEVGGRRWGDGGLKFIPPHKFSIWRRKPNRNYVSYQWIISELSSIIQQISWITAHTWFFMTHQILFMRGEQGCVCSMKRGLYW